AGLTGSAAARRPRARLPGDADPHLRRRHQRDPARPDRRVRAEDAKELVAMDFSFTEEQNEIQGLARQILSDKVTHERLKEIEADPDWFDREVWSELAKSGLVGIGLPED